MHAVIQINHAVYGIGSTKESAINAAREWVDNDTLESDLVEYSQAVSGDMVCIPCSNELAAKVNTDGGDILYEIVDGVAVISE